MEPPELFSEYLYSPDLIHASETQSPELAWDMPIEKLRMTSREFQTNAYELERAVKMVKELRISIKYHHVLIILHFAHRSETLFEEILQREWPNFLNNRSLLKWVCKIKILLHLLTVKSPKVQELHSELHYLRDETLSKDYQLWNLVQSWENPDNSTA